MQQLLPKHGQGFIQQQQQQLMSKQRERQRQTSLYFKIPQAKPLLSKHYIDYSKPKVLIKQIKIIKQPSTLSNSSIIFHPHSNDRALIGRKQQSKQSESTLWKRYILSSNYKCIYAKYMNVNLEELQSKNNKKLKHELLKLMLNRQYLFATYIMDMNFLTQGGGTSILRNLQQVSFKEETQYVKTIIHQSQFDSRFQCGNLMYAFSNNDESTTIPQYYLILQNDINTKGYGNWFYFRLFSKRKGKHRFHIVNIQKTFSFFSYGMRPAVFSAQKYMQTNSQWHYDCYNIVYQRNQLFNDQSNNSRFTTLSFTYQQLYDDDTIYFAANFPYSYSKLVNYIDRTQKISKSNPHIYFRKEGLAATLSSNQCLLLTITWKRDKKKEQQKSKKKIVLILARQHPSEIVSSYIMQGIINRLTQGGQTSVQLLKKYIFKIIPMVNIDGVIYGNSRCDITGSDVNRKWTKGTNQFMYPIITAIKKMVNNLIFQGYQIEYFIDLHGHSRKLGSFIYGCNTYDQIETRMFAWIMAKINDKFSYQNCRFGISNFRRETARGYMMNIASNRKSMTVQTSFYGYKSPNGVKAFQTSDLHSIGESLVEAIHIDTHRNSKLINWNSVRTEIKDTIKHKINGHADEQYEQSSGSDSNPEIDELPLKDKVQTFLNPTAATKLGLIDIKVVQKSKKPQQLRLREIREFRDINLQQNDFYSNNQFFNQNYDTILNQKYLQSQMLVKTQRLDSIKQTKSITKIQPFKFKSLEKKSFSMNKKIHIAIDIQRIEKKEQRLSTPSLPSVRRNGKQFWNSLKKQYDNLLNQKKSLLLNQVRPNNQYVRGQSENRRTTNNPYPQ